MQLQFKISLERWMNICDELNQSIDSNPEENYEVFLKLIKDVQDK